MFNTKGNITFQISREPVYSLDPIAIDVTVFEGDMVDTFLEDASLNHAVFSLPFMGENFSDNLREAH